MLLPQGTDRNVHRHLFIPLGLHGRCVHLRHRPLCPYLKTRPARNPLNAVEAAFPHAVRRLLTPAPRSLRSLRPLRSHTSYGLAFTYATRSLLFLKQRFLVAGIKFAFARLVLAISIPFSPCILRPQQNSFPMRRKWRRNGMLSVRAAERRPTPRIMMWCQTGSAFSRGYQGHNDYKQFLRFRCC